MSKKEIQGVYGEDLLQLLEGLRLKEDFESGKIICDFCGDNITQDNFLAVFPDNGEVKFSCGKSLCRIKLTQRDVIRNR